MTALWTAGAATAQTLSIAAVVNQDIVTSADLAQRVRMAILETGAQPDSQAAQDRLTQQVLRQLIDERLMVQEANRDNVKISDKQLDDAIASIAQGNGMSSQQFEQALLRQGMTEQVLKDRTEATLAWRGVVERKIRPTIDISDAQLASEMERLKATVGKPQVLLAEIYLSVPSPAEDSRVRQTAEQMVAQLRQGSVHFSALASQFSESASSARGGDIGWVQPDRLDPELSSALQAIEPGQVTSPIPTPGGYYILLLRERRVLTEAKPGDAQLDLQQIVIPFGGSGEPSKDDALARAAELRRTVRSCDAFTAKAKEIGGPGSGAKGSVRLGDLADKEQALLQDLDVNRTSPPLENAHDYTVFMICQRTDPPSAIPSEDKLRDQLAAVRVDRAQRQLLQDLRRAAYVDIRM
ncbi:peptidylprolyl isomerase [Radicibacter daui]|uniref:peptidylprolyl isomerase n=1 Tax=Radicibacter daui TaxID=3064829 RepID=UPI004046A7FB